MWTMWSRCSLSWVPLEDHEKLGGMATRAPDCGQRSDLLRLWKMKIPMALELGQSAFACPHMPYSPKPPGTADLGFGALSSASRGFTTCFILCIDFLMQEKGQEYQGALSDVWHPFSHPCLFYWLWTICTSRPQAVPQTPGRNLATGYLFFCPWVLNSWILRTKEQGVSKRTDELSCGSIKGEEAQQEC